MNSFTAGPHNKLKHCCPSFKKKKNCIPLLSSLEPDFFPLTAPWFMEPLLCRAYVAPGIWHSLTFRLSNCERANFPWNQAAEETHVAISPPFSHRAPLDAAVTQAGTLSISHASGRGEEGTQLPVQHQQRGSPSRTAAAKRGPRLPFPSRISTHYSPCCSSSALGDTSLHGELSHWHGKGLLQSHRDQQWQSRAKFWVSPLPPPE